MAEDVPGEEGPVEVPPPKVWPPPARDAAAVLWTSFLSACFATLVFFGLFDPDLLGEAMTPSREVSRMAGYGIGFFFFWLVALLASALTLYLIRTGPPNGGR